MSNGDGNGDYPVFGLTADKRSSIETLYRSFSDKNPDLLDQALVPDWQDIPLGPDAKPGREGMKPVIEAFVTAFPDLHIDILEIIGASGRAGVRAEITGTHRGEWLGVAATQRSFRIPLHEFHRLEAGKITHTWHLEDWFGWLAQVGALKSATKA